MSPPNTMSFDQFREMLSLLRRIGRRTAALSPDRHGDFLLPASGMKSRQPVRLREAGWDFVPATWDINPYESSGISRGTPQ